MDKLTIKQCIVKVLEKEKTHLSPKEIYEKIISTKMYEFKSENPISIVNAELRNSSNNIELKKSRPEKLFEHQNGKFKLITL